MPSPFCSAVRPRESLVRLVLWVGILLVSGALPSQAQQTRPSVRRGSVFVEAGGNAGLLGATFNAELPLSKRFALRAGAGVDIFSATTIVPIQGVFLIGHGSSRLELAAGVTIANEPARYSGNWHWDGTKPFFSGFVGYRFQRERGFLFRFGVVPLLWTNTRLPWPGVSFGTSF